MGISERHALSREQVVSFHTVGAPYGGYTRPSIADKGTVQVKSCKLTREQERIDSLPSNAATRALHRRVSSGVSCGWEIGTNVVLTGTAGDLPDHDRLMFNHFGMKVITRTITIVDYSAFAGGETVTATLDGSDNDLVEGVDFDALTSNAATATSLASALDGIDGLSASADSAVVTVSTEVYADGTVPQTFTLSNTGVSTGEATFAGVSVLYRHAYEQGQALQGVIHQKFATYMRALKGVIGQTYRYSFSGKDRPECVFSGVGSDMIFTGSDVATSPSGADFDVTDPEQFEQYSLVQFRSGSTVNDNSGAGWQVSSVSGSTVTAEGSHGASANDIVEPFLPYSTPTGTEVPGINGSATIDGTSYDLLSFDLTSENNHEVFDDVALTETVQDYSEGDLSITGTFTIRAAASEVHLLAKYMNDPSTTYSLILTNGGSAGNRVVHTLALCELKINDDVGETAGRSTVKLSGEFTALASADGSDYPLTVKFY